MSRWIEERESDGFFDVLDDGGGAVGVVASCLSYADAKSLIDGPDLLARAERAEARVEELEGVMRRITDYTLPSDKGALSRVRSFALAALSPNPQGKKGQG